MRNSTFIRQLGIQDSAHYGLYYGLLYNWYAVNTGDLAPYGWHVPTYSEWNDLYNLDGYNTGAKMKEVGYTHWNYPNTLATDEYGFTALPGGYRGYNDGGYHFIKENGVWWSSTEDVLDSTKAVDAKVYYNSSQLNIASTQKNYAFSIRCVRHIPFYGALYNWYAVNDSRNIAPELCRVPTDDDWTTLITYLGGTGSAGNKLKEYDTLNWATPNSDVTNSSDFTALPGGYRNYSSGDYFNLGNEGKWWTSTAATSTTAFNRELYYNSPNANRYFFDRHYGFSIRCICEDETAKTITDWDGNMYDVIDIGTQRWLVQDLRVTHYRTGAIIENITNDTDWTSTTNGAYCFYEGSRPTANKPTTITDVDGNTYDVISIGRRLWLKQNLTVRHYNNGDILQTVPGNAEWAALTVGAYCAYNNDE